MSYLNQVCAQSSDLEAGAVYTAEVYHDEWCAMLKHNRDCNCNPVLEMTKVDTESR